MQPIGDPNNTKGALDHQPQVAGGRGFSHLIVASCVF